MINEFISEDYKNAKTFTEDNCIIKTSTSFMDDGKKERSRTYIDNGGKCMILVEIIEHKYLFESKFDTRVWVGSEEALTTDYNLLAYTINKSEGEKKEQLRSLLEKLSNEHKLVIANCENLKEIYKHFFMQ